MTKVRICNGCGKALLERNGILQEDVFEGAKQWGYFSAKDGVTHRFLLCEKCYDLMVSKFVIPPEEEEITEW